MKLHLYKLNRKVDVSGSSGVGQVAHAIGLKSGKVVMWWNGEISSIVIYDSIANVEDLHSHNGATLIETIDDPAEVLEMFGFDAEKLLKKKRKKR